MSDVKAGEVVVIEGVVERVDGIGDGRSLLVRVPGRALWLADGPHIRNDHPRTNEALRVAVKYGGYDGDHHKTWVIDQMVRALTGDGYAAFIKDVCAGDLGPDTYEWDEGTAP